MRVDSGRDLGDNQPVRPFLLLALCLSAACFSPVVEGVTPGTGSTSDTDASDTSNASPTIMGTTSPMEPSTTTTSNSGTDATSDGSSTTGGVENADYIGLFAGPDGLVVRKLEHDTGLCLTAFFLRGFKPTAPLVVTSPWGFSGGFVHDDITDCLDSTAMPNGEFAMASAADGAAAWMDGLAEPHCPPQLDINISFTFPGDFPWVPKTGLMQASGVIVANCSP